MDSCAVGFNNISLCRRINKRNVILRFSCPRHKLLFSFPETFFILSTTIVVLSFPAIDQFMAVRNAVPRKPYDFRENLSTIFMINWRFSSKMPKSSIRCVHFWHGMKTWRTTAHAHKKVFRLKNLYSYDWRLVIVIDELPDLKEEHISTDLYNTLDAQCQWESPQSRVPNWRLSRHIYLGWLQRMLR